MWFGGLCLVYKKKISPNLKGSFVKSPNHELFTLKKNKKPFWGFPLTLNKHLEHFYDFPPLPIRVAPSHPSAPPLPWKNRKNFVSLCSCWWWVEGCTREVGKICWWPFLLRWVCMTSPKKRDTPTLKLTAKAPEQMGWWVGKMTDISFPFLLKDKSWAYFLRGRC